MLNFKKEQSCLAQYTNIPWVKGLSTMKQKAYWEPCQISEIESFKKRIILDVWQDSEYTYDEAISLYIS